MKYLIAVVLSLFVGAANAQFISPNVGTGGGGGSTPPGGSNTQIQFNDLGAFGGNAAFVFDKTTGVIVQTPSVPSVNMFNSTGAFHINGNPGYTPGSGTYHRLALTLVGKDGESPAIYLDGFGASPTILQRTAMGTGASPTAPTAGDRLGRFGARAASRLTTPEDIFGITTGSFDVYAAETMIDPTNMGTYVQIATTPIANNSGILVSTRFQPSGGISVGDATFVATDQGQGIIAAQNGLRAGAGSTVTSTGPGGALASAAFVSTGTSGATVPLLNGANTWSANQTISLASGGASLTVAAAAGNSSINLTTDTVGSNLGISSIASTGGNSSLINIPLSNRITAGSASTGGLILNTSAAAPIIFGTGGNAFTTERVRISATGGQSIGSNTFNATDPGAGNLAVQGTTTAGSFIPTSSTMPTNGMYLATANSPRFSANSTTIWGYDSSGIFGVGSASFRLGAAGASATVPSVIPNRQDQTTGIGAQASGNISLIASATEIARVTSTGIAMQAGVFGLKGFTVATLPASPTQGATAFVTDQTTACAATGAALTGGGSVACPVFYNGSAWVGG